MDDASPTKIEVKMPDVTKRLDILSDSIDICDSHFNQLEEMLKPVLSEPLPTVKNEEDEKSICGVGEILRNFAARVTGISEKICNAKTRLQI